MSVIEELASLQADTSEEMESLAWAALLTSSHAEEMAVGLDYAVERDLVDEQFVPYFRGERVKELPRRYWVHHATQLEMAWIPPGVYLLGYSGLQVEFEHNGFFLSRHPVTKQQFSNYVVEAEYDPPNTNSGEFLHDFHGDWAAPPEECERWPVVWISQVDAQAYCDYYGLGLPSEWEWESAARGFDHRLLPWGLANHQLPCWRMSSPQELTQLECSQPCDVDAFGHVRTAFGCEQMVGNVSEWCRVEPDETYYAPERFCPVRGSAFKRKVSKRIFIPYQRTLSRNRRNDWTGFRPMLAVQSLWS